jgi:hypothetical protein
MLKPDESEMVSDLELEPGSGDPEMNLPQHFSHGSHGSMDRMGATARMDRMDRMVPMGPTGPGKRRMEGVMVSSLAQSLVTSRRLQCLALASILCVLGASKAWADGPVTTIPGGVSFTDDDNVGGQKWGALAAETSITR